MKALDVSVKAGGRLTISLPENDFAPAPAAKRHLLFVGGIGVTPVLAMARAVPPANSISMKSVDGDWTHLDGAGYYFICPHPKLKRKNGNTNGH